MNTRRSGRVAVAALILAACANSQPATDEPDAGGGQIVTDPVVPLECQPDDRMPLEGRASPYDSVTIDVAGQALRICYGRPSARDREIFGGLVAYDELWRTGANEPTILHLPFTADIGDLRVPPGSYSLYTIPGQAQWTLIVNRSTSQWGHEDSYTAEVEAQELGRTTVATERLDQYVEQFTIRGEPTAAGADILLQWERTRVRIPVARVPAGG